ncbi:unnamed protein product, partial [Rotaria magnacalcarata]
MIQNSTPPPDLTTFFNGFSNEELHQIGLALIQQSQHFVQLQQHIHHPASSQQSPPSFTSSYPSVSRNYLFYSSSYESSAKVFR